MKPPKPDDLEASSCDWGFCDEMGVTWRWSGRWPKQWLPVCSAHAGGDIGICDELDEADDMLAVANTEAPS